MTRLSWNEPGSRIFETGVSHGVLYTLEGSGWEGVSWNGLTGVTSNPEGGAVTKHYNDGFSHTQEVPNTEFAATLTAYTYPEEFNRVQGLESPYPGLYVDNQEQEEFGLTYRTLVGNDIQGTDLGYKLHIIYNAIATPTTYASATETNRPEPTQFSWGITTTPENYFNGRPTAHLVVDSRETDPVTLSALEDLLYGDSENLPTLPSLGQIVGLFMSSVQIEIVPQTDGLNLLVRGGDYPDLSATMEDGLYSRPSGSRLTPTAIPGLYTLE